MKKMITILEDDEAIRELCTLLFTEEGYLVESYSTTSSFFKSQSVPDIYLLDVRLPDGDGLDVCSGLKADPKFSNVPVIMMSAHLEQSSLKGKCTAECFIAKPFDIENLILKAQQLTTNQS